MTSYVERFTDRGESVVYKTTLSPVVLIAPAGLAAVGIMLWLVAVAGVSSSQGHPTPADTAAAKFLFGLGVLFCVPVVLAVLNRNASEFAVTTRRVIMKQGVLRRRAIEILLDRVEGISVAQSILGRVWDYGTIIVKGTGGTPERFLCIASPLQFRAEVNQQIEQLRKDARGVGSASAPHDSQTGPRVERECPHCAEPILAKAKICKHCGKDVVPAD